MVCDLAVMTIRMVCDLAVMTNGWSLETRKKLGHNSGVVSGVLARWPATVMPSREVGGVEVGVGGRGVGRGGVGGGGFSPICRWKSDIEVISPLSPS